GQGDHTVDEVGLDERRADLAYARLVAAHAAVSEDEAGCAVRREMVNEVLDPREVRVAGGRDAKRPSAVVAELLAAPVAYVERRIGEDEVGLEIRQLVGVERVALLDPGLDAADREVHLAQPPGRPVQFLAEDRDVALAATVLLDEPLALDEHPARATARVVDP